MCGRGYAVTMAAQEMSLDSPKSGAGSMSLHVSLDSTTWLSRATQAAPPSECLPLEDENHFFLNMK